MANPQRLKSHLRLGMVLLVVGALALTGLAPARRAYEQREQIADEQQMLEELTAENRALEERMGRLQDPAYMEKLIRQELGVARPGDTVYVMPEAPQTVELSAQQAPAKEPENSPLEWLKERLGLD